MFRIASQLQERGVAPVVKAAFLNYSHPTLAETVETLLPLGITEITIQPYFLIAGVYVKNDLRTLIEDVNEQFPMLTFHMSPVLGEHAALTDLAQWRVQQAQEQLGEGDAPSLLLMAHGTPRASANAPLYTLADILASRLNLANARVSYLDCNSPTIPQGIEQLVASGAKRIIALPYFLHLGRHVAEDLPEIIAEAQAKHSNTLIHLAHHLDYDLRLVDAVQGLLPLAKPLQAQRPSIPKKQVAAHPVAVAA